MNEDEHFQASFSDAGRYRMLVDSITDYAIYMLDLGGHVTSWNRGAQRFKGYEPSEIIGEHFSRFYTEEDRAGGLPARALKQAATEGRFEAEGWRVRKDGGRFWAHVVIDPITQPDGELIGYAKITRDLTERRAAEDTLRRSEEQFRLLVQGVTDYALYMLDPQGYVSNWNVGAQRIKGYRPEEIVGQHFSRFYTEDDRALDLPARALEIAAREGRFEKEGWRVRKDGSRFWAHVVIDPIRNDAGEVVGYAKITRDITERREAQLALETAREALFQSQKLDAIGQLTGGVAHDFNNLLMAVLGSLELVRKRVPPDPKITPLIENAIQGAERGAALTQRLLAFARKQELQPTSVELPALVRGIAGLLQRSLGPTVELEDRIADHLPPVRTDYNQLETALLNLAVNARDAMPDGGVITIDAWPQTVDEQAAGGLPPGDYVKLLVRDTGFGMDLDTLARASEPFFTTKGIGKGTGLGLSMVHGLAEQSGGRLMLHSRPGEGTTAELWLPVAIGKADAPIGEAQMPEWPVGSLIVMAVDDDDLVLMNTSALLEDMGHKVLRAASGAEALLLLRQHEHVDVVITDYAMPNMTGLELAEAVRGRRPQLPIILATGYAEVPVDTETNLPRLAKPFKQRDLRRALAEAMRPELVS